MLPNSNLYCINFEVQTNTSCMKILVIGGNFAGFTAAILLKNKLKEKAEVTLVDRNENSSSSLH